MAKRRLTQQQKRRIQANQSRRMQQVNQSNQALNLDDLGPLQIGVVVAHYKNQLDVSPLSHSTSSAQEVLEQGQLSESLIAEGFSQQLANPIRCRLRANLKALVTGDYVVFHPPKQTEDKQASNQEGIVVAGFNRFSEFYRPDSRGQLKTIAANIQKLWVVIAPVPTPFYELIDRYLVATNACGIEAGLILNKSDLLEGSEQQQTCLDMMALYQSIGYEVRQTSPVTNTGIADLLMACENQSQVFVGQSGVGKSSITRLLIDTALSETVAVGGLSEATGKGTHTTTTAKLYQMTQGAFLIDSPGIRDLRLWPMTRPQLAQHFVEFEPYIHGCRFHNCQHDQEPGCQLKAAVESRAIATERFASFNAIANQANIR